MLTAKIMGFLLLGVALICAISVASPRSGSWLATGTVTKVDGSTVYFLSQYNAVFRIDTSQAKMFYDSRGGDNQVRAGTKIRVFGCLVGPSVVKAARVRVLQSRTASAGAGPKKEVRIIVEKDVEQTPSSSMDVGIVPHLAAPSEETPTMTWQGKGLITSIDFVGKQVVIQTTDGPFTVNVNQAVMVRGAVRTTFGRLNQGDTIWVAGNEVAPNVVDGRIVRVLRTASEAQNAVTVTPVSRVGVIQQIDYPSRTFRMTGVSTGAVVSVDDNTVIQFQDIKKCFADLKPGTKINMSGYGNLASGFAAQHIQIIAVTP